MTTESELEALQAELAQAKQDAVQVAVEGEDDIREAAKDAEAERLRMEIALVRGETYTPRSVTTVSTAEGEYVVPMGTVVVDTDLVAVTQEQATTDVVPPQGVITTDAKVEEVPVVNEPVNFNGLSAEELDAAVEANQIDPSLSRRLKVAALEAKQAEAQAAASNPPPPDANPVVPTTDA